METSSLRLPTAFLLMAIGFAPVAAADPVTVASGKLQLNAHDTPVFTFTGDGFMLSGFDLDIGSGILPFADCLICDVGDSVRLSTHLSGEDFAMARALAGVEFDGVTYDQPIFYSGELDFNSGTGTVPETSSDPFGFVTFEQPFTFTGTLLGFLSPQRTGSPAFTANLHGSGSVRFLIAPGVPGTYNFTDLTYTFDTANPVPEPGTMVLLGSGLLATMLRARRRNDRRTDPQH